VFSLDYYLYIEASGNPNKHAVLTSKTYPGGDYCITFYLHMYGPDVGFLDLNAVATSQEILHTWSGDHGDQWSHKRVNAHVHTTGSFQVIFQNSRL